MGIIRTPIIDDDGSGRTGTIINNAWKTELYNQIDNGTNIPWNDVPFNAANFTSLTGSTWTVTAGNQIRFAYRRHDNKTMTLQLYVANTVLAVPSGGTDVAVIIPDAITVATGQMGTAWIYNPVGVSSMGLVSTYVGRYMVVSYPGLNAFVANLGGNFSVAFSMTLQVVSGL